MFAIGADEDDPDYNYCFDDSNDHKNSAMERLMMKALIMIMQLICDHNRFVVDYDDTNYTLLCPAETQG